MTISLQNLNKTDTKNSYATPKQFAIEKMFSKLKGITRDHRFLDPSAGKGDLLDELRDDDSKLVERHTFSSYVWKVGVSQENLYAIEIDPTLQATLKGKGYTVLDGDFLRYNSDDMFDVIVMNPPFDDGVSHLNKAIDILYSGQIVCVLNAETIRNPYSNDRKALVQRLKDLNAEFEYVEGAFSNAERKSDVEVVIVYINIEKSVNDDFLRNMEEAKEDEFGNVDEAKELTQADEISALVERYNATIKVGKKVIFDYYQYYSKIGRYIGLIKESGGEYRYYAQEDLTQKMKSQSNDFVQKVRIDFWKQAIKLDAITDRLTSEKQKSLSYLIESYNSMDFTESNIRQLIMNMINDYEGMLRDAVVKMFDRFSQKYSYRDDIEQKNVHYYNGWKTNKAFKINKKVIFPVTAEYSPNPFIGYSGEWRLNSGTENQLNDVDKIMSYFDGFNRYYRSISEAVKEAFNDGENRNIESTYFKITCYKKGTIHLTFKDDDLLRRFNIVGCQGKGWLPQDYGTKKYNEMSKEELAVVSEFDGLNYKVEQDCLKIKNPQLLLSS